MTETQSAKPVAKTNSLISTSRRGCPFSISIMLSAALAASLWQIRLAYPAEHPLAFRSPRPCLRLPPRSAFTTGRVAVALWHTHADQAAVRAGGQHAAWNRSVLVRPQHAGVRGTGGTRVRDGAWLGVVVRSGGGATRWAQLGCRTQKMLRRVVVAEFSSDQTRDSNCRCDWRSRSGLEVGASRRKGRGRVRVLPC